MNGHKVCFKDKHKRFTLGTSFAGIFSEQIRKELINSVLEDFNGFRILGILIEIKTLFWALYLLFSDEHKALNFGNRSASLIMFFINGEVVTA